MSKFITIAAGFAFSGISSFIMANEFTAGRPISGIEAVLPALTVKFLALINTDPSSPVHDSIDAGLYLGIYEALELGGASLNAYGMDTFFKYVALALGFGCISEIIRKNEDLIDGILDPIIPENWRDNLINFMGGNDDAFEGVVDR